ncbi:hypothetical protein CLF_108552 [Clonorchis sinensis]|uniref:Integrase catalytic domain-containing protein n=1 Tax=Clonorchis sinensis TaxID=79923 RepID=G7YRQ3_CLOSI|nr:hypothetical protein CLF_108552 [Clonorchis sinensis]
MKKFHKMLYDRHFTLVTDHKPLLAVFGSKKGIPVYTANRLQRWGIILLGYNFTIRYASTEKIGQADALTRLIASREMEPEDTVIATVAVEPEVRAVVLETMNQLPVTFDAVRDATKNDSILQKAMEYHQSSWPTTCPSGELRKLFQRRSSLSVVNGCLLFGDRIVLPTELRQRVLAQFHSGHPGISFMKPLARSYVYWPGMDEHMEQVCRSCFRCAAVQKLPNRQLPQPWPQPEKPWSRIHMDFAGPINEQSFLIVLDAFSKWPEVLIMSEKTTMATITKLRHLFSTFGIPETFVRQ